MSNFKTVLVYFLKEPWLKTKSPTATNNRMIFLQKLFPMTKFATETS